jgi:hypothetical protein
MFYLVLFREIWKRREQQRLLLRCLDILTVEEEKSVQKNLSLCRVIR